MENKSPVRVKSVFFSLIVSFVFIVVLIAGGIQGIFYLYSDGEWEMQANWKQALSKYAWYLTQEIGTPPDVEKAKQLSLENNIKLVIQSPNFEWKSDPNLELRPRESQMSGRFKRSFHHPRLPVSIFRGRGNMFVEVERAGFKYVFIMDPPLSSFRNPWLLLTIAFWIGLVILLFYWRVRKMFYPLHILQRGFEHLGSGEINYKIQEVGRHEFKFLFASFNEMTGKLQGLWEGQRRLLSDISHELRTPLTRMKLSLALMPHSDHKQELEQNIDELAQIINTVLETERLQSGVLPERKPQELGPFLQEIISKQQKNNPERKIIFNREADVNLSINSQLLTIAMNNIINNALKYSLKEVIVSLKTVEELGVKSAQISVQDFGIGISKEDQSRIFTPFFRTDSSRNQKTGGVGLGLNLSHRIIQAHQGRIQVKSELEMGSIFTIVLP